MHLHLPTDRFGARGRISPGLSTAGPTFLGAPTDRALHQAPGRAEAPLWVTRNVSSARAITASNHPQIREKNRKSRLTAPAESPRHFPYTSTAAIPSPSWVRVGG
jgi:hypothetical protein